jgi:cystathionine gamma-synthase
MAITQNLYTCGVSIPYKNPHAISVLLPTMKDVIGYEEHDAALLSRLESAYPRF